MQNSVALNTSSVVQPSPPSVSATFPSSWTDTWVLIGRSAPPPLPSPRESVELPARNPPAQWNPVVSFGFWLASQSTACFRFLRVVAGVSFLPFYGLMRSPTRDTQVFPWAVAPNTAVNAAHSQLLGAPARPWRLRRVVHTSRGQGLTSLYILTGSITDTVISNYYYRWLKKPPYWVWGGVSLFVGLICISLMTNKVELLLALGVCRSLEKWWRPFPVWFCC